MSLHINVFSQQKRKLRIFISNTFNPAKPDAEDGEGTVASWELRVEGRLLEDVSFVNEIYCCEVFLCVKYFTNYSPTLTNVFQKIAFELTTS